MVETDMSTPDPKTPRYLELADRLRREVRAGVLKPGDRLPSFAAMKAEHGVSQNTWDKAHALLEREHVVVRLPNKGTFVAEQESRLTTGSIGIAMGETPWRHPYYSDLLKGIHQAAHEAHVQVLLLSPDASIEWEKVDGVLAVSRADSTLGKLLPGMPCTWVLHELKKDDNIIPDDAAGIREAIEYLLSLGHRRIAYLTTDSHDTRHSLTDRRLTTYEEALRSAGIAPNPRWVRLLRGRRAAEKEFPDMGRDKMRRWLRTDWHDLGCTALLAQNDDTAIGVIEALQENGISVPDQVSVMGFDGTDLAQYYRPRLTTVQVPLKEIGAAGLKRLLERIDRPLAPSLQDEVPAALTMLPTRLMIGQSTAPPVRENNS